MKKHKSNPKEILERLKKEIEKFTNENRSGKSRINYFKNKLKDLGMKEKKSFIPFKHRLLLKKHKLIKQEREKKDYGEILSKKKNK
ncbi:hypothetical protein TUBRATIS_28130 [Tubulinosema ratisbonensis]|uniref:Uncharacterized protein n=1 Tax=Tubulinosema ratisbonensis TaxID=291195 RepID=A0A437AHT4_9MICR|nr:hypothetical protein TUBRATIS_28130 [Tubulinosema ratisbonensis]